MCTLKQIAFYSSEHIDLLCDWTAGRFLNFLSNKTYDLRSVIPENNSISLEASYGIHESYIFLT